MVAKRRPSFSVKDLLVILLDNISQVLLGGACYEFDRLSFLVIIAFYGYHTNPYKRPAIMITPCLFFPKIDIILTCMNSYLRHWLMYALNRSKFFSSE